MKIRQPAQGRNKGQQRGGNRSATTQEVKGPAIIRGNLAIYGNVDVFGDDDSGGLGAFNIRANTSITGNPAEQRSECGQYPPEHGGVDRGGSTTNGPAIIRCHYAPGQ